MNELYIGHMKKTVDLLRIQNMVIARQQENIMDVLQLTLARMVINCAEEMLYENVKMMVTGLARNHSA